MFKCRSMFKTRPQLPAITAALTLSAIGSSSWAAQAGSQDSEASWWWNLLIATIVLIFSLASALLPLAALKQWYRHWRLGAALPLLGLGLWVVIIVAGRVLDSQSHRLWPFEIFAWAMLNMIYMVALMTAKRVFEKADQENSASS